MEFYLEKDNEPVVKNEEEIPPTTCSCCSAKSVFYRQEGIFNETRCVQWVCSECEAIAKSTIIIDIEELINQ